MAKKLAGSTTLFNKLLNQTKPIIFDYERYESGELKIIGHPDIGNSDVSVRDCMSFGQWLETYKVYPIIKVEGLERILDINSTSIHLFYNQKTSRSFNWHTDEVTVDLLVLRGWKSLQIKNKKIILTHGQTARIPKGHLHRAFSRAGTWALSIGK
jgi:mannose-6-phosphate isomerase-like protein (cupin superfamily)